MEEFVLLSLLAAVLAVDERAGWQSLLSRPVFVALPIGAVYGQLVPAMMAGVGLELVWLSILPMRGTRAADTVSGAVVGVATTCLLLRHVGDHRVDFMVATGVLTGLVVGQGTGYVMRWLNSKREGVLGRFELPADGDASATVTSLVLYNIFSIGYVALSQGLVVLVVAPVAFLIGERATAVASESFALGAKWWIELLPALGAAAIIQHNWHKNLNRFLVFCACLCWVVLWVKYNDEFPVGTSSCCF